MASTTGIGRTRDGVKLLTREWLPAGAPRAAVLLVHGLGEHCGRYEHVGEWLSDAGFVLRSWDQCGFGGSDGDRAYIERWAKVHDDVEDQFEAMRAAQPGIPTVILGHSLGGLITTGYVVDPNRPKPDVVILSAPALDDDLAAWKHALAPILGKIAPRLRIANGVTAEMLSRDADRQSAARTDPLMVGASTARFGAEAIAEQARVRSIAPARLTIPTLVIHGLADPVVPPRASEGLAANPNVTRLTYPGVRHELHNEPEGPAIYRDVIAWLDGRLVTVTADPTQAVAAGPVAARV